MVANCFMGKAAGVAAKALNGMVSKVHSPMEDLADIPITTISSVIMAAIIIMATAIIMIMVAMANMGDITIQAEVTIIDKRRSDKHSPQGTGLLPKSPKGAKNNINRLHGGTQL